MTKFYASQNWIGTDQSTEGAIEITSGQYKEALLGMMEGKRIDVINGELQINDPPRPDPAYIPTEE